MEQTNWDTSILTAKALDQADPLKAFRDEFYLPGKEGKPWTYLCGNSLGLQPRSVESAFKEELDRWKNLGVEGWFEGERPWLPYHRYLEKTMAKVVGANPKEVVIMNTLTVNLHLLMASFFRPKDERTKILMEKDAFPSDHHMVASQLRWHGLNPDEHIIYVFPDGDGLTSNKKICQTIEDHKSELALVFLGGVNYFTGQLFDIETIARTCRSNNIVFGVDLAHGVGNVELNLHEWGVDFAAWCTYKYLNSGPGGPGGIFVHENQTAGKNIDRLAGWWGHDEDSRFVMDDQHVPMAGAAGWQISTPQIMNFVALGESLSIFANAGMGRIATKRRLMNAYFDYLIKDLQLRGKKISVVTPTDTHQRGAQFSIRIHKNARNVFDQLIEKGIIGDWRSPDMIRLSPAPLYNTFEELHHVYTTFIQLV